MAKIKKLKGKSNTTNETKICSTAPSKTINGKVKKVQAGNKILIKCNDEYLKANQKENCSDALRSLPSSEAISSNCSNRNTLRAQCNNINVRKDTTASFAEKNRCNDEYLVGRSKRKTAVKDNISTPFKKCEKHNIKYMYNNNSTENKNNVTTNVSDISVLALKDSKEMLKSSSNKLKSGSSTKYRSQNQVESLTSFNIKKCMVKLPRIPTAKEENNIRDNFLTPSIKKKCVVRLPRIITTVHSTLSLNSKNSKYVKTVEENANMEPVSSKYCSQVPELDNNKRSNFRKLSLTKSFRKCEENDKTKKNINSNDHEQEIQEVQNRNDMQLSKDIETCNETIQLLEQKTGRKNHNKRSIKQIDKLSLKKIVTNLEDSRFEPQSNSTLRFDPARSSTLLKFDLTYKKHRESQNEDTKNNISSKDKSSSQNLAHKSDEIENLLNSLDDEEDEILLSPLKKIKENVCLIEENNQNEESQSNISQCNNKSNKFFHRKKENVTGNIFKEPLAQKDKPKAAEDTKKRRYNTKRSIVRRSNIYEFLSQSQTSDSESTKNADPTADIIKKLIEQGKVRVATNCKGKGKPKFKRKRDPTKQLKKVKQYAGKKCIQLKNKTKKVTFMEENKNGADQEYRFDNNHFDNDHFDNEEHGAEIYHDMQIERRGDCIISNNYNNKNVLSEQEGSCSTLARSVLINQTGRSISNYQTGRSKSELLEAVRNIVSTPKNKKMPLPETALQADFSPIAMLPPRKATLASPWRVNEDAYLPKTFNFSRGSGNLPSFSSDYIPLTPRKEKSKSFQNLTGKKSPGRKNIDIISNVSVIQSPLRDSLENVERQIVNLNDPSVIASFSSNDSNAENIPPPRCTTENHNENEKIFESKQLPNPRRALKNRSPLKTINILEVVHLPPYRNKTPVSEEITAHHVEISSVEKNLDDYHPTNQNVAACDKQQNNVIKTTKTCSKEDLFGFEDYLSQTDLSSQESNNLNNDATRNEQNQTIHDKLQNLRKFKPSEKELQESFVNQNSRNQIKHVSTIFDDDASKKETMRQRGIREMLCSTMLNPQPSTSKEALKQSNKQNFESEKLTNFDLDFSELFKDPEPETTFNENEAHRTYIRPLKRKRRLKVNNYVMFLDSDESEDEDNSHEKQKRAQSLEANVSPEKTPRKKRQRKEPKENPELIEFVQEFNELCKEVESFELIVEKIA